MKDFEIPELGQSSRNPSPWMVQDFADVVIHLFAGDQREFYDIESLWVDAPQIKWQLARKRKTAAKKEA
jgi:ribosome-associated protein